MPAKGYRKPIVHGTHSGYLTHSTRKEPVDREDSCGCRAAHTIYMNEWRKARARQDKRLDAQVRAQARVALRFRKEYPTSYKNYLKEELRKVLAEDRRANPAVD